MCGHPHSRGEHVCNRGAWSLNPPLLLLAPHCLTLRILHRNKSSKSCLDVEHAGLLIIASGLDIHLGPETLINGIGVWFLRDLRI